MQLDKNSCAVQFLTIYLLTEQHNCRSQNSTSAKNTHNTKEKGTYDDKTIKLQQTITTFSAITTNSLTAAVTKFHWQPVTWHKQISIQQSAVRICDGPKQPAVTDIRYIIRNRDRQQGYKCTTPVVTIHTTWRNNKKTLHIAPTVYWWYNCHNNSCSCSKGQLYSGERERERERLCSVWGLTGGLY